MGQILGPENLPTLVVASTTSLTLAATNNGLSTRINVGGQQYTLPSILTLNTSTTGANGLDVGSLSGIQLWYVYAIVNQTTSVVALVASLTTPATGPTMPTGYGTAYKLVGAFYSNGASQVGSMVTINGTATTQFMSHTVSFSGSTSDPTITAYSDRVGRWRRNGSNLEFRVQLSGTWSVTGSGDLVINAPTNLLIDVVNMIPAHNDAVVGNGIWYKNSTTTSTNLTACVLDTNRFYFVKHGVSTNFGELLCSDMSSNDMFGMTVSVPIVGWSATLL